jgi:hypothetical protein
MATAHTKVTIANRALDYVSENPLVSLSDAGPFARWINRNFTQTVRMTTREQPWNFARRLHLLQEDPDRPPFRWRYRFQLPHNTVRVLTPTADGSRRGKGLPHEVLGNFLMMNHGGPRPVEIIEYLEDPGQWDDLFAEVIAARLAVGMCKRFTGKRDYLSDMIQMANQALDTAVEVNAYEGSIDNPDTFDIIRARYNENPYGNRDWLND